MTPVVLRSGPYRCYFYSHESSEPPHIHVDRDERSAKFWLTPLGICHNFGFGEPELRRIEALLDLHHPRLMEAWHEFFRTPRR